MQSLNFSSVTFHPWSGMELVYATQMGLLQAPQEKNTHTHLHVYTYISTGVWITNQMNKHIKKKNKFEKKKL